MREASSSGVVTQANQPIPRAMIEALLDCNLSPGFLDEVAANPSTDRHPQLTTESWLPESDLKAFAVQEHKSASQASEAERSHIRESCEYSGIEGLTPAAAVEQILRTVDDLSVLEQGRPHSAGD